MNKSFTIKGYWFLPNQEEQKIAGILSYEPGENIRLELFGALAQESPEKFLDKLVNNWNDIEVIPIIHGHTSDGNIFTLIDCLEGPSSLNSNAEFPLTSLTVNTAIRGLYLKERDEKKFTKIRIGYNLFREWLGLNGFKRLETDIQTSVAVSYKHPEIVAFSINNYLSLKFTFYYDYIKNSPFECIIKQSSFLEIQSTIPVSYRELREQMFIFQDFLSMATLSTIESESVKVYLDNPQNESLKLPDKNFELYFKRDSLSIQRPKHPHKFLFNYATVASVFEEIIKKWYASNDEISPIRKYLIESVKPIGTFKTNHFLNIVQALEGFHTRFRVKEMNLKDRLKEIVTEFSDVELVKNQFIDLDEIVGSAGDSRHYYSHFFKAKNNKTKYGAELYHLTKKLRILLICCVLKQVGFSNAKINEIVISGKL